MIHAHDESMLELAALRAIDALEAEEASLIDKHMVDCEPCRAAFAQARTAASALAYEAASPAPPALRTRVLAGAVKIRRIRQPWYRQTSVGAAAAAAIVLIVGGAWLAAHRTAPHQQWTAQCTATKQDCGVVEASAGTLRLDAQRLPQLPAGKIYQAWLIHPKQAPLPEPTFSVSSVGGGTVEMQAVPAKGDVVAVTVEPIGGSKAPTSTPVLVATLD